MEKTRGLDEILMHKDHPGCSFWESPDKTILVITNPNVNDLVAQTEEILKLGFTLVGGIQLIRRDNGDFNGTATFLKVE